MAHIETDVNEYRTAVGADGQLVDVREPAEVAAGMLPDAVNIPMSKFVERVNELDPERPVVRQPQWPGGGVPGRSRIHQGREPDRRNDALLGLN